MTTAVTEALDRGDIVAAESAATAALVAGTADAFVRAFLAWQRLSAGDAAAALAVAAPGLEIAPDDVDLLTVAGAALRLQGRIGEALGHIDRALQLAPGQPDALLQRALALHRGGLPGPAYAAYAAAAAAEPSAAAYGGMAAVASAEGRHDTARAAAMAALQLDGNAVEAQLALARADITDKATVVAQQRLAAVLAQALDSEQRIEALTLMGDASVAAGDSAGAVAAYRAAKALYADHWGRFRGAAESHAAVVARLAAGYARLDASHWPADAPPMPGTPPRHAFLIGFPRSGTTMVETILASLPGVTALEERATLAAADRAWLAAPDGLAGLAAGTGLAALRADYWQQVAALGAGGAASLFVDMDPLKGLKLPAIARLFPAARIIVMRRDPRDVVWSCFRRNFTPSAAALEFTSLDATARHYAALMALQEDCLARLPIARHVLRYEALVSDFDTETRALCDFLDMPWTPALRDFGATAAARTITTISAGQVRQGLYNGSGQWRRHAAALAPVLPILQPWLARFGYPD